VPPPPSSSASSSVAKKRRERPQSESAISPSPSQRARKESKITIRSLNINAFKNHPGFPQLVQAIDDGRNNEDKPRLSLIETLFKAELTKKAPHMFVPLLKKKLSDNPRKYATILYYSSQYPLASKNDLKDKTMDEVVAHAIATYGGKPECNILVPRVTPHGSDIFAKSRDAAEMRILCFVQVYIARLSWMEILGCTNQLDLDHGGIHQLVTSNTGGVDVVLPQRLAFAAFIIELAAVLSTKFGVPHHTEQTPAEAAKTTNEIKKYVKLGICKSMGITDSAVDIHHPDFKMQTLQCKKANFEAFYYEVVDLFCKLYEETASGHKQPFDATNAPIETKQYVSSQQQQNEESEADNMDEDLSELARYPFILTHSGEIKDKPAVYKLFKAFFQKFKLYAVKTSFHTYAYSKEDLLVHLPFSVSDEEFVEDDDDEHSDDITIYSMLDHGQFRWIKEEAEKQFGSDFFESQVNGESLVD